MRSESLAGHLFKQIEMTWYLIIQRATTRPKVMNSTSYLSHNYRRIRRPKVFRMRAYLTVLLPHIFAGNIYIMSTSISCPLIHIELEALGDLM
jgi:hypothetical protein